MQKVYDETKNTEFAESMKSAITYNNVFAIENDVVTTTETFPRDISLPDGIVKLNWTRKDGFAYVADQNMGLGNMSINPTTVTYPAQIAYYANTGIRTKDSEETEWSSKFTNWTNTSSWTGWTDNAGVSASTRAIALKEKINYGVASLKLQVKCAQTLKDHNGTEISIPTNGFKVTGLLIGAQPSVVDYAFQPTSATYDKTIYDCFTEDNYLYAKAEEPTKANYTIVLPSEKKAATDGNSGKINFAIEVENETTEFTGVDGVIPAGGKFYLIGTLDPEKGTIDSSVSDPAVFMSDYQTTAKVTISSLAKAYNCIPDIRNTSQQLGLSVDLNWEEGYKFDDITIGGDNN